MSSGNGKPDFHLVRTSLAAAIDVAVERGRAVVDRVPVVVAALAILLTPVNLKIWLHFTKCRNFVIQQYYRFFFSAPLVNIQSQSYINHNNAVNKQNSFGRKKKTLKRDFDSFAALNAKRLLDDPAHLFLYKVWIMKWVIIKIP